MNTIKLLFWTFSISYVLIASPILAQYLHEEICVPPQETYQGLITSIAFPYYPTNTTLKALVIFVKFSDDNYDVSPHTDLWPHTLNTLPSWAPNIISPNVQPNYSNPSISGYFDEMSLNQFQLIGNVYNQLYIPLQVQSYYWKSSGRNISYLTEEILTQLDPYINYAQYDNLSPGGTTPDGIVDMIFICFRFFNSDNLDVLHYTGYASLTGSYSTFGSGSSSLTLDGVQINAGFPGSGTIQSSVLCQHAIGVIVHEYGHYLFGGIHYAGIGYWGLMDGRAPGSMCAYERNKLNWLTPNIISSNQMNVCLHDAITTGDIKKLEVTAGSHYFLTENRQQLSYYENNWLQYNGGPLRFPGPGFLITHVTWNSYIDVECADKKWDWKKSGSYYVYPFEVLNTNPFNGLDEMELRDKSTTSGIKSHDDFRGDANDVYKLDSSTMFSPWSNPNSNSVGGYGVKNFSDKAIILKSMNGTDMYVDFYTILDNNTFSASSEATAFNSQRKLLRTGDGRLHLVLESEGEIYYRRTLTDGTTWENSTSVYLSTGNSDNTYPSLTGTSSKQFVVWQRYTGYSGGQYKYDTYFAKNTGSGWSMAKIDNLSNLGFSTPTDPLPVVTYKTANRLLVCARTSSAIKHVTSDNDGSTWSSAANVPATSSSHQNPSLSMGPTTPASTVYVTYDNDGAIYLNSYTDSWGAAASIPAGTATLNSKNASVEVDGANGINVAWEGKKRFGNKQIIFHRRKYNGSWQTATYFESSSANYYRPSITGHDNNNRTIVWYSDGGAIYHAYYNGSNWSQVGGATDTWLQYANISSGTTTAKYVSTGGLSSPYTIYLSSETFPSPGGLSKIASGNSVTDGDLILTPLNVIYHRSASLQTENEESSFWLELGEIAVNDSKENFTSVDLISLDEKSLNVTLTNIFDHLQSDPFELATDAQTIEWTQKVYLHKIEKLLYQGKSEMVIKTFVNDVNTKSPLTILNKSNISFFAADSLIELKVQKDIKDYQGRQVYLSIQVEGIDEDNAEIVTELGHNYLIQDEKLLKKSIPEEQGDHYIDNQAPSQYKLDQNYPNPFNASTVIQYHLTNESHVELAIYNLIGQKICTIQNERKQPGYHSAT